MPRYFQYTGKKVPLRSKSKRLIGVRRHFSRRDARGRARTQRSLGVARRNTHRVAREKMSGMGTHNIARRCAAAMESARARVNSGAKRPRFEHTPFAQFPADPRLEKSVRALRMRRRGDLATFPNFLRQKMTKVLTT